MALDMSWRILASREVAEEIWGGFYIGKIKMMISKELSAISEEISKVD